MIHVLIDTTHLFDSGEGFGNPNFQKILKHSNDGYVKIYVSHITWEERRTQILESAITSNRLLKNAIAAMAESNNILLEDFPKTPLYEIDDEDLKLNSKKRMDDFASKHNITVVPFGSDHADRAWQRYFETRPPFDISDKDRKNRRKDIPDSWILESAIDLKASQTDLVVLAKDGKLSFALEVERIRVVREFSELIDLIEKCITPATSTEEKVQLESKLDEVIKQSQQLFEGLEKKVLGYIAYLDGVSKSDIFDLLIQSGHSKETYENVAYRLVLANLITDSGNHYLIKDKKAAALALKEVEDELIKLVQGDQK